MENHPQLKAKLRFLYILQLNNRITSNSDLAAELGKSRQSISRWCIGTETKRGDSIPVDQISKVAKLFGIQPEWLSLSLENFESNVRNEIEKRRLLDLEEGVSISTSTLPITNVDLFGREVELNLLDELWFNDRVNVTEIVAFGGEGKTSLINKWLSEISASDYQGAKKVYAWSFYWQSSSTLGATSSDYFIESALNWFGDPSPAKGTPWSKAIRLARLIRNSKTLLILDGLEAVQRPAGEKHGQIVDPVLSLLVKELATDNNGLCVITTRFPVADLAPFQDGRVYSICLARMTQEAAIAYLKSAGVNGTVTELIEAVESYSGHALSLSLLAGYIVTVCEGKLRDNVNLNSAIHEEHNYSRVEKLLSESLCWLEKKPGIQILRIMSLYDKPTSLLELQSIAALKSVDGLSNELVSLEIPKWKYAVRELDDVNLINSTLDKGELLLDCHPLVKEWINQQTKQNFPSVWKKGNEQIFNHLKSVAEIDPHSISEYETLFKAVGHATNAELYHEAFGFYYSRIKKAQFSLFAKGSINSDRNCISQFFDEGWKLKNLGLPEDSNLFLKMCAATNLVHIGETEDAIYLFEECINWFRKHQKWLELAIASAQFLSMLIISGKLKSAKSLIVEMKDVVLRTQNTVVVAGAASFEGYIAFLEGNFDIAEKRFTDSERVLTKLAPDSPAPFPTVSTYYCKYLLERGSLTKALERCLKSSAWRIGNSWQTRYDTTPLMAGDMLILGLVFLQLGDTANAKAQLFKQVELLRSADEWLYLPAGLNSRARYFLAIKNFKLAFADLNESIEISKRTGAKFGEWEAHLDMANLFSEMDDLDRCAESLNFALEMPGMSQYKFRDKEIEELENRLAKH